MRLCQTCRHFDLHEFRRRPDFTFARPLKDIDYNAASCDFCDVVRQRLPDAEEIRRLARKQKREPWVHLYLTSRRQLPSTDSEDIKVGQKEGVKRQGFDRLHVKLGAKEYTPVETGSWARGSLFIAAEADSPPFTDGLVDGCYPGSQPRSQNFVQVVHHWLQVCEDEHQSKACWQSAAGEHMDWRDVPLPTRCIDVTTLSNLRLRDTKDDRGCYLALSHQWSGLEVEQTKTTLLNLQHRLDDGLDSSTLPNSIANAIEFTHNLGFPYLWIDSICIVQGEGGDFQSEGTRMLEYYSNAALTISLELPPGDPCRFLNQHKGIEGSIVELPYYDATPAHKLRGWYCAIDDNQGHFEYQVRSGQLHRRGWVFQEYLISRRILHFTFDNMYFECAGMPPRNEWNEQETEISKHREDYHNGVFQWYALAELYSQTLLSRPHSDKVVALSGVAQGYLLKHPIYLDPITSRSKPMQYVAGLWLHDIHKGLLWERDFDSADGEDRLSNCGAPSWSWTANCFAMKWSFPELEKIDMQVVSCYDPRLADEQIHGALFSADCTYVHLMVSSKMARVTIGRPVAQASLEAVARTSGCIKSFGSSQPWAVYTGHAEATTRAGAQSVIGWASIEDADMLSSLRQSTSVQAHALLIAHHRGGMLGPNVKSSFSAKVADVLFVLPADARVESHHPKRTVLRCRRVGVGMLYSPPFKEIQKREACLL